MRKAYIPNFRPLVPFLHVKKFVVVDGWWWWVLKVDFSIKLNSKSPQLGVCLVGWVGLVDANRPTLAKLQFNWGLGLYFLMLKYISH